MMKKKNIPKMSRELKAAKYMPKRIHNRYGRRSIYGLANATKEIAKQNTKTQ